MRQFVLTAVAKGAIHAAVRPASLGVRRETRRPEPVGVNSGHGW